MDNPAAWHTDPTGRHEHRWWDGQQWTEHVADAGQSSVDPLEGGAGRTDAETSPGGDDTASVGESSQPQGHTGPAGSTTPADASGADTTPSSPAGWERPAGGESGNAGGWGEPGGQQPGQRAGWAPQQGGEQQPQQGWQGGGPAQPQQGWQGGGPAQPQQGWQGGGPAQPQQGWQGGGPAQPQQGWQQQQQQQQWPQATPAAQGPPVKTSGLAITALILGILSLVFFWVPILGGLGALIAILFGFLGRGQAKKRGAGGGGMGIAGIITGIVALLLNILITLAVFGFIGGMGNLGRAFTDYADCMEQHNDAQYCDDQLENQLPGWLQDN